MSVARLLRAKRRVTRALKEHDDARLDRGKPVDDEHDGLRAKYLRSRLYRIDLLLEREGVL